MQKNKFSRFNDGVVSIYRDKERMTDFNARRNSTTLADMDFIAKLDYEEMSKREQDLDFAEKMDFSLSMKVKTRFVKSVDNKCKAVIDGYLYDISYIDKTKAEMFLYMEQIRKVGENV